MTTQPPIIDSPTEWVADHITRYVETNGEDGHIWRGVPTLLLTTTGHEIFWERARARGKARILWNELFF